MNKTFGSASGPSRLNLCIAFSNESDLIGYLSRPVLFKTESLPLEVAAKKEDSRESEHNPRA